MTSSERPPPEPLLKKEASLAALAQWGGDNSGNALEASNALEQFSVQIQDEIQLKTFRKFRAATFLTSKMIRSLHVPLMRRKASMGGGLGGGGVREGPLRTISSTR